MDEIAERVAELVERYGPRSVAIYPGTYSGVHPASIPFSIGWLFALGSRMLFTASTIDQPGKSIANALHERRIAVGEVGGVYHREGGRTQGVLLLSAPRRLAHQRR